MHLPVIDRSKVELNSSKSTEKLYELSIFVMLRFLIVIMLYFIVNARQQMTFNLFKSLIMCIKIIDVLELV